MNNLTISKGKDVGHTFRWKDQRNNFYVPEEMETRHLFYTIRMIWNHNMSMKLEPYKRYVFSSYYTKSYMQQAIRVMIPILAQRTDLTDSWKCDLEKMINWLKTHQLEKDDGCGCKRLHNN